MIILCLCSIKTFLLVTKYGPEATVQQRKLQNNVAAPGKSKKRKRKSFKCKIPIFNLSLPQKAESVEVLDKGPITNVFTIYFF